jgi:hypothetical protein
VLGVFQPEQDAAAPGPVLRMTEHEANGDTLTFKADRGEIVDDCLVKRRDCLTCRLSGHAIPGSGLEKHYTDLRLTQYCGARCPGSGARGITPDAGPRIPDP